MLTTTWVMADDGLLRRDPVVRGVDRNTGLPFYLCFGDGEPPELVLCVSGRRVCDADVIATAEEALEEMGVVAIIDQKVMRSVRCFGGDASCGPYREAAAVFIDILQPPPASLFRGRAYRQPRGDCYVYSFGGEWG